jgi:hypothetical protein
MIPMIKSRSQPILALLPWVGLLLFWLLTSPTVSAHDLRCQEREEVFGFTLEEYGVEHQGNVTVDMDIMYRLITSPEINPRDYPDFVPILGDIQGFITNYPNETDYWEIFNRNLVEYLLEQYPQIAALRVKITVRDKMPILSQPVSHENYERFSVVTITRSEHCPLNHTLNQ